MIEYLTEWNWNECISLEQLKQLIPILQKKYGKRAVIRFDAGFNNVSAIIYRTKGKKRKEGRK